MKMSMVMTTLNTALVGTSMVIITVNTALGL